MESPLRYIASDDYSSPWLKFHLGHPRQLSQRTRAQNAQQQQQHQRQQQPQHLNTLGLRLNAAGNIKPSVVHMPSVESRWKIHYSYKAKVHTRAVIDDPVTINPIVSQRSGRESSRSESGKRSPAHGGGLDRTRARSAAIGTLARGREQRSPRIRTGTPELVTTTPIRLLGVLRSPEHALNWRANDGKHQPPRYFTFPPVTGSRIGLTRQERRDKVSTAPAESRFLRSWSENEDMLTLSRSSSSESLPSSWKYMDGRQTNTRIGSNEVTDNRAPRMTEDPSIEIAALPTINEEDALASEMNHSIRVRISRNNSNDNRHNNCKDNRCNSSNDNRCSDCSDNDRRFGEAELHRRVNDDFDDYGSDNLSVYNDDSEGADEEQWTGYAKSSIVPATPQTQLLDNEGVNRDQDEDHDGDQIEENIGHQREDQNADQKRDQNENHCGHPTEDHSGDQHGDNIVDKNEDHNGEQSEDQSEENSGDGDHSEDHNGDPNEAHNGDPNEGHNGDPNEGNNGDPNEGNNDDRNVDQNGDLNEDHQRLDQNGYLDQHATTDQREGSADDHTQEIEKWTKEANDFSPTQRTVHPPLTSRDWKSDSPTIPQDIFTANQSHMATECMHDITDEQDNRTLALKKPNQKEEAAKVEHSVKVDVADVAYTEALSEGRDQDVIGQESGGKRDDSSGDTQQQVEHNISKETKDENNNVLDTHNRNEATNGTGEIGRNTSSRPNTEEDTEAHSTKNVERDSHDSLEGNVVIDSHRAEANEEAETETAESLAVNLPTDLLHAWTESRSDLQNAEVHPSIGHLDDLGQQNDTSPEQQTFRDERLDSWSEENVSLESTGASLQEESRRSPATRKPAATRKRSVRFSQDVATVYLYVAATPTDDSETSDSGFLSP